jgi:hypothetical protein
MDILDCQREMRSAFLGGFAGQLVAGVVWLVASGLGQWGAPIYGMAALFVGSMLIFPLTQAILRIMGRPARVNPENRLWALGAQSAFSVGLSFLVVGAIGILFQPWFFPAAMIVVGAHYLVFITLYGMRMFGMLAAILAIAGASLAIYGPQIQTFSLGGWLTALILIAFAFIGKRTVLQEEQAAMRSQDTLSPQL